MSIKEIITVQLDALLQHPSEEVRQLSAELLAKLVVYNLDREEKKPVLKIV